MLIGLNQMYVYHHSVETIAQLSQQKELFKGAIKKYQVPNRSTKVAGHMTPPFSRGEAMRGMEWTSAVAHDTAAKL